MDGLYFEQFSPGQEFAHDWTRTVTEMDNVLFSSLTMNVQPLHIDAEFDVDITRDVDDHDIHSVLDYRRLREAIVEECTQAHVNLIETLSEQVARRLLRDFAEVRAVKLRISKPMAFSDCAAVGVEIQINR